MSFSRWMTFFWQNQPEKRTSTLEQILSKLETFGVYLKSKKCKFLLPEVIYLGHKVNKDGIQLAEEKVQAIHKAPCPTNIKEV